MQKNKAEGNVLRTPSAIPKWDIFILQENITPSNFSKMLYDIENICLWGAVI